MYYFMQRVKVVINGTVHIGWFRKMTEFGDFEVRIINPDTTSGYRTVYVELGQFVD